MTPTIPRLRPTVRPLAALLAGTCLATACTDATVEKARSDREVVAAQAEAYATAIRSRSDSRDALDAIASEVEGIARDGDAAANLLLARIRLDLGRHHLDVAMNAERRIAARRTAARNTLTAATALAAGAEELRRVGFETERDRLETSRTAAEGVASSSQAMLREIDRQSRLREAEIDRLADSVRAVEEQATGYRELASREDVVGAPEFLALAAEARATAGRFRVEMADERTRLVSDANRSPRHTRAAGDLAVATADLEGSARGIDTLASIDESIRRQAATLAETAAALRQPIVEAAEPDADEPILGGSAIGDALDAARREYAAAAGAAGRAASGGDRGLQSSARVLGLNARLGELTADLVDAERLGSEAGLLAALGESPSEAARLREEADAIRERATERLASIEESIDAIGGNGATARMLQAAFASAVDRLAGIPEASGDASATGAPASGGAAAAESSVAAGPPFSSADALAAFIASGGISDAPPATLEKVLFASSRGGKQMLNATLALSRTGDEVRLAMIEAFGTAASPMPGGFGLFEGGSIASRGDGEVEFESDGGTLRFVEQGGGWRLDYEDMLAASGMSDPAAMSATAGMMEGASGQLGPFFRMFAQRIRNGEFDSAEAAHLAMAQEMARAMMQSAGLDGGRR